MIKQCHLCSSLFEHITHWSALSISHFCLKSGPNMSQCPPLSYYFSLSLSLSQIDVSLSKISASLSFSLKSMSLFSWVTLLMGFSLSASSLHGGPWWLVVVEVVVSWVQWWVMGWVVDMLKVTPIFPVKPWWLFLGHQSASGSDEC